MGNLIQKIFHPTNRNRNHMLCHCEQCCIKQFINDRVIAESLQYNESTRLISNGFNERNTHVIPDMQIKTDEQIAIELYESMNK